MGFKIGELGKAKFGKFKKMLDSIGKHRDGGNKWTSGNLSNTKVSTDLNAKYKKMCKTIGMHRNIDRLSKIKTDKELAEKIYEIASDKFKDDMKALRGFAEFLYKKVDENKFREENEQILENLYDAVNKFRKQKRDVTVLPSNVTAFYDDVSVAKNFGNFVDLVYEKRGNKKGDFEVYLNELRPKSVDSLGKTKKIMINYNTPVKVVEQRKAVATVPTKYSALQKETQNMIHRLIERGQKLAKQYLPICDELTNLLKKSGAQNDALIEVNEMQTLLARSSLGTPEIQRMLENNWKEFFKCSAKEKDEYKRLFAGLKDDIYYGTRGNVPRKLNGLIEFIYLMYCQYVPEELDKVYNAQLNELKYKIRKLEVTQGGQNSGMVKGIANQLDRSLRNSSNAKTDDIKSEKSKIVRGGSSRVSELRKKFESQGNIMGVKKPR